MRHLIKVVLVLIAVAVISACSSEEEKKASHLEKGKSYFQKGEYKKAIECFQNVQKLDKNYRNKDVTLSVM